jgi:adenosine deaminase
MTQSTSKPDRETIQRLPKVNLHDHLDGGLRPETILDLAQPLGVDLPAEDPDGLRDWFHDGARRGDLKKYLEGFGVTCAVMQTAEGLERVAFEALEDLHDDGVVYAELRFAPQYHTRCGLNLEEVMNAVLAGMHRAEKTFGMPWGLIVCGMRNSDPALSLKMAELAVSFRDRGCVGFDVAGDESGHPPKDHLDAFQLCQRENFNITIHAGEAFGPPSIWQALQYCGAHRIGHCTRLLEDMVVEGNRILRMGRLAQYILDHRIPLEICLSSNMQTGAVRDLATHPFSLFLQHEFRVTLNTDNRLMSGVTTTDEYQLVVDHFGCDLKVLERISINSMKSAFIPYERRCDVIFDVIKPGFRAIHDDLES